MIPDHIVEKAALAILCDACGRGAACSWCRRGARDALGAVADDLRAEGAREGLSGLMAQEYEHYEASDRKAVWNVHQLIAEAASDYRDDHYPRRQTDDQSA